MESENVIPLPDNLERLAIGINQRVANIDKGRAAFIEDAIAIATMTVRARDIHRDNISFGRWWDANIVGLNKDDRAALIEFGQDPALMRVMLEGCSRVSYQLLRAKEWPRVLSAKKTPANQTANAKRNKHAPKKDRAVEAVEPLIRAGADPSAYRKLADEIGISHGVMDNAVSEVKLREAREALTFEEGLERGRKEGEALALNERGRFSKAQAHHVEALIGKFQRDAQKQIDAVVEQRVDALLKQRQARLDKIYADYMKLHTEAYAERERYRKLIGDRRAIFTGEEFKIILMALHPDNSASPETRAHAFRLVNERKPQLTKER